MAGGQWTLRGTLFSARTVWGAALCAVAALAAGPMGPALADNGGVVVTIKPIHSLVVRVMEGVGTPLLLVDGQASPHSFSLRPSQVQAIDKAAVFIRVSERLETFTGKLVRSLPDGVKLVSLIDAPGVKVLEQRQSGTFDEHDHAEGGGEDHSVADSHIWLDPDNAKAIGSHVAEVLAERFPENAARFRANAKRLSAEIDALTKDLTASTLPLKGKPFVVFHDAYQYFDRRFDLDAVGSITVSPDVQPSARRIIELREKIRELKAVCVFAEPLFQQRLVGAVIEDSGARAGTLDPEGLGLAPGGELYFTLMRNLALSLKSCLAPST